MALPPGLLPETTETRPARAPWILGFLVFALLVGLLFSRMEIRRLSRVQAQNAEELAAARRAVDAVAADRAKPTPPAPESGPAAPVPEPPSVLPPAAPTRAPEVRIVDPREDAQYITRGLHEFRASRFDQAERQFFRAIPESLLYLALTGLAQRNWGEAFAFLRRAMAADPNWLKKVNPRDLFGSGAEFEGLIQALDDQVSKNPLDPDLKTLQAYLRYHEKGAPYAKALLIEASTTHPDHEAARVFLEALGP